MYKFFWGGPFSNWCRSEFTINNVTYNCGEQYMMHQKALLFNDNDIANKIMSAKYPKEQKKLGRLVKNYDNDTWDKNRYDIVKKGLREKFLQNEDLKNELLKYKGWVIVEASPEDSLWGIGFHQSNALENKDKWGLNLLGKILTELTNEIK